jgi:hypothetical protein
MSDLNTCILKVEPIVHVERYVELGDRGEHLLFIKDDFPVGTDVTALIFFHYVIYCKFLSFIKKKKTSNIFTIQIIFEFNVIVLDPYWRV